ncbi:MAG: protein-methionine-sulfoxide reductase catalytic subunit MsrP [Chloroflexi bacterium]|nr:protein-methionine-sulfoxide reductase catalytic subunit MsrP [Chloroflexota bacterium]
MGRAASEPPGREITPEGLFVRRREFLKTGARGAATAAVTGASLVWLSGKAPPPDVPETQPALAEPVALGAPAFTVDEPQTPFQAVASYNNYYEFGLDKGDPVRTASTLRPRPWTISVEGDVLKPRTIDIDTLLQWFPLEERVYRMRCVEAWSMVIPWLGFPLSALVDRLEPTGNAKFIEFTTLNDPEQMPGLRIPVLEWPYVEGLRLDEARNPLAFMAAGLYGKMLPNQNGAPLRLVAPWKYGFKGAKSIVKIRFTSTQPRNTWNVAAPNEYGFYANVNPAVDHPRWSQAAERRIGELTRRPTLPFNGYANEVASLYAGMDLRRSF